MWKTFAVACCLTLAAGPSLALDIQSRVLATGDSGGLYYQIGTAFQQLVNTNTPEHGVRMFAERSRGSVENVQELLSGRADFAIVQADVLAKEQAAGNTNLRAVMGLHTEILTVLAAKNAGVSDFSDLAGKRVNLATEGSGSALSIDETLSAVGLDRSAFRTVTTEDPTTAAAFLCSGKLDAMVLMTGHPSREVKRVLDRCDTELVALSDADIKSVVLSQPAREPIAIPAGVYRTLTQDVPSFGVRAVLATRDDVPDETVATVVRSVFPHASDLGLIAPALQGVTTAEFASDNFPVPLHDGARTYFADQGVLNGGA